MCVCATQVAEMASWGVNVVRVGWLFNGLMPQPNFVNETYYKDSLRVVEVCMLVSLPNVGY